MLTVVVSFEVAACQKAGQNPPNGWLEPDPNGKQLASLDLSILRESKSIPDK